MVGSGPTVFAVMGYVIARARKSRVELNPKLLAAILGCDQSEIEQAVEFLCSPDELSRNKEAEGRRLVKEGTFQYYVPSWKKYRGMRNEDDRREYNRLKQQERRARIKNGKPLGGSVILNEPGETTALKTERLQDQSQMSAKDGA